MSTLLEAALDYAHRGMPVFPVHGIDDRGRCTCGGEELDEKTGEVIPCREGKPGKHPRVSDWGNAATTVEAEIRAWWERWPLSNIGMPTGAKSGLDVIDDDRARKGLPTDALTIPEGSARARTGGGGVHHFTVHVEGVSKRTNFPTNGVDLQGDGAFVILPPSRHVSGQLYTWEVELNGALPSTPSWALSGPRSLDAAVVALVAPPCPMDLVLSGLAHATERGALDPADYDTWIRVGMALRFDFGDEAFDAWDEWSSRAPNYGETEKKWPTFKRKGNGDGPVVTTRWILAKATECGWEPPLEVARKTTVSAATSPSLSPPCDEDSDASAGHEVAVSPEPYPLHLFPEQWTALLTEVSRALCTDPAIVGTIALVVFAAAVGYSRALRDSYSGWRELAAIWAAVVMISGGRKSPAFSVVTKPLRSIQHDEYRKWKEEMDRYQQELIAWKAKKKNERGEPPDPPQPLVHLYSTNATPEKLAEILGDQQRGTAFLPPELAGMFAALGYKKGAQALKDVALFLCSFNAEGAKYDRVMKGTVWIPAPLISIVGTIQPGLAARLFAEEEMESGLAARFLFLHRHPLPKRYGRGPSDEVQKWWANLVRWAYFQLELQTGDDGETQEPLELDIDEGARDLLRDFVPAWDTESSRERGAVRAALAKLEGYALRFALLFRLLREHAGLAGRTDPVSREDLERGIELARWYRAEAIRTYEELLSEGRAERRLRLLVQVVRQHHGIVTARDWGRSRNLTSAEAEKELGELVELGLLHAVQVVSGPDGGRPTTAFIPVDPRRLLSRPLSGPRVSSGGPAPGAAKVDLSGPLSEPGVSSAEQTTGERDSAAKAVQTHSLATPTAEQRSPAPVPADETLVRKGGPESPKHADSGHRPTDETPVRKGGPERGGPESPEPDWEEASWRVDPREALLELLRRKGPSTWSDLKAAARFLRTPEGQALLERAVEDGDVIREEVETGGRPRVLYRAA